jgi:hypothetical protein
MIEIPVGPKGNSATPEASAGGLMPLDITRKNHRWARDEAPAIPERCRALAKTQAEIDEPTRLAPAGDLPGGPRGVKAFQANPPFRGSSRSIPLADVRYRPEPE